MHTCVKKTNIPWWSVLYKQTQVYIKHCRFIFLFIWIKLKACGSYCQLFLPLKAKWTKLTDWSRACDTGPLQTDWWRSHHKLSPTFCCTGFLLVLCSSFHPPNVPKLLNVLHKAKEKHTTNSKRAQNITRAATQRGQISIYPCKNNLRTTKDAQP